MKVLIDINHPGHVHFFKNLISNLKHKGIEIIIIASDKDVTIQLLKEFEIEFILFYLCFKYNYFYLYRRILIQYRCSRERK
jgi:predicted glycosyltransferase